MSLFGLYGVYKLFLDDSGEKHEVTSDILREARRWNRHYKTNLEELKKMTKSEKILKFIDKALEGPGFEYEG